MAKPNKVRQLKSCSKKRQINTCTNSAKDVYKKKHRRTSEKKDWEDAICPVCMESPHNAVLLLCSSYNKGCRPYMCATSCRFSNCLDQYNKAYTKLTSLQTAQSSCEALGSGWPHEKEEVAHLSCPICRGEVKGWTVVESARKYLNKKKRSCMQEDCSFVGSFKQLKKHVKAEHPLSRPREVDPALEEKWKSLELERERNDVLSAITSADPGAIVMGDFVIEGGNHNPFFRSFGDVGSFLEENNNRSFSRRLALLAERQLGGDLETEFVPASRHHRRLLFGRMARRARNRDAS